MGWGRDMKRLTLGPQILQSATCRKTMFSCRHGKGPWPNLVTDPKSTPSVHGLAPTQVQYIFPLSLQRLRRCVCGIKHLSHDSLTSKWLLFAGWKSLSKLTAIHATSWRKVVSHTRRSEMSGNEPSHQCDSLILRCTASSVSELLSSMG